jgi:hypothetical protein
MSACRRLTWSSTDGATWIQAQPIGQTFAPRTYHSAQVVNGRMYVIGGVSDTNYDTGIRYNDVWSTADGVHWREDAAAAPFAPRSGAFNDVWRM